MACEVKIFIGPCMFDAFHKKNAQKSLAGLAIAGYGTNIIIWIQQLQIDIKQHKELLC